MKAVEEPPSLVDLRKRVAAMLPRVDLPEMILEVMSWAANAPLVARQAAIPLAQAWGGGLVAAVDGMRFVVPVPAAFARPNRKFFGPKRGTTWLNAINDQGAGIGAKDVAGTARDSLHMVDVIFGLDGGELPEIVASDNGSYSEEILRVIASIYTAGPPAGQHQLLVLVTRLLGSSTEFCLPWPRRHRSGLAKPPMRCERAVIWRRGLHRL